MRNELSKTSKMWLKSPQRGPREYHINELNYGVQGRFTAPYTTQKSSSFGPLEVYLEYSGRPSRHPLCFYVSIPSPMGIALAPIHETSPILVDLTPSVETRI